MSSRRQISIPLGGRYRQVSLYWVNDLAFLSRHCPGLDWLILYHPFLIKALPRPRLTYNLFNTLRPRQNGRHFPDDIFIYIFLNENVWISIKISLKFVPKGPINKIPALVQIMAWRRPGDKPLSEPVVVSSLTHICVTRPQWVNYQGSAERALKSGHG